MMGVAFLSNGLWYMSLQYGQQLLDIRQVGGVLRLDSIVLT